MRLTKAHARQRNRHILTSLGAIAVASLTVPTAAYAQSTDADTAQAGEGLSEVTVTARRTEEKLETVPFSVSAFSSAALESQNTRSLVDISRNTPSFQFQNQAGGGSGRNDRSINNLTFRGLVLGNVSPISQGGLVFIDGAPVINAATPAIDDVARVEVLKGPQAVYFGRSTFSGAINFVTKDPEFEFSGRVKALYGDYDTNQFSLSLNAPIVDDVIAARLGFSHERKGGQYKNAADLSQTFGTQSSDALSAQILIKPSSNLKIKGFASYSRQLDSPPAQASLKQGQLNCNLGGTYGAYYCGELPNRISPSLISGNYLLNAYAQNLLFNNPNNFATIFSPKYNQRAGLKRETYQADVRIDYDLDNGMSLSSITAYHRDKTATTLDLVFRDARTIVNPYAAIPGAPATVSWLLNYQSLSSDFSQELRLTSAQDGAFRWTFGGSYFRANYLAGTIIGVSPFGPSNSSTLTQSKPNTPAVFAAAYVDILPELTLSLEGRYQWDHIKQVALGTSTGVRLTDAQLVPLSQTNKSFSPRVSLDYKFTPNSTVYALFSRGYRPGGFNAALAQLATTLPAVYATLVSNGGSISYEQEKLDNYEAGIKSRFWNNRASVRFSAYYDQYRNGQVANSIPYFAPPSPIVNLLAVIQNIGAVDLKGIELEGDLSPVHGLQFNGSLGINDSKIKSYVCQECLYIYGTTDATGNRLSGAPKWTWTLGANYEHPIQDDVTAYGRIDYRHRGSQFVDNANVAKSRPDDQVDVRLGMRTKTISIEGFVTNLFNEQTLIGSQSSDLLGFSRLPTVSQSEIRLALPEKRRVGIRASYEF